MPFLKFENIDKSFGENHVISKFNLEVEKGKFIVFAWTIWMRKIYTTKNDSWFRKNR